MKATVIRVESGDIFTDGKERVTLRFDEADTSYNELRVPNRYDWPLGYRLTVLFQDDAALAVAQEPAF